MKKKILAHLKDDIETFKEEAHEDRELIRDIKKSKKSKKVKKAKAKSKKSKK